MAVLAIYVPQINSVLSAMTLNLPLIARAPRMHEDYDGHGRSDRWACLPVTALHRQLNWWTDTVV
jgi:hypothetical protein